MSPSSTVHGGQHDNKFELLMHAECVTDEIWGFTPEIARNCSCTVCHMTILDLTTLGQASFHGVQPDTRA